MNKFIKEVIEEKVGIKKFKSKPGLKKKPIEKKVDEVVDDKGNISRSFKHNDENTKGITSNSTSDEVAKTGAGSQGFLNGNGVGLKSYPRYWGEADMSKSLGYEDTLGQDDDYEEAKDHFEDELGIDNAEAEERLAAMGYDKNLPQNMVRLVENPKKFIEEYIDSILSKRTNSQDLVKNKEKQQLNKIVQRQMNSLKDSMKSHGLTTDDIIEYLKDNE